MRCRGAAGVEYIAAVAAVAIAVAGLLLVRPRQVDTRTPVDVIPPVVRLLGHPVENLAPRAPHPAAGAQPRPVRPRTPRPRTILPTVALPDWWR